MSEAAEAMSDQITAPPNRLRQPADPAPGLLDAIRANRFLPAPPPESIYVGDGDYHAIGTEFLDHFVRLGGLRREDRVLDVGCGIGRMAVPLTQYLDPESGAYDGFDPVSEGIMWCSRTITPIYPNFRFHRLDVAHPLYNSGGCLSGGDLAISFPTSHFDFVSMVSVATHLPDDEIVVYAREIARVLKPGGRLFMTAFMVDPERTGASSLRFSPWADRRGWIANGSAPLAAIGFERSFFETALAEAGLVVDLVSNGHWAGEPSDHFQDVIVASKAVGP